MIKFYRGLKDSYSIAAHGSDIYFATDTLEILHGGNSYSGLNKDKVIKDIDFANGILTITYTDGSTNELDSNLVTKTDLSNKVDKVSGKQLSTNDFTNDLKTKLENSNVYKQQFRALSALPDNGDGWYSIASIGDTESSIVQISSGGHTDVQVAINTGWAGNTTGSLTVLNSFVDDTNGNHAFVKAVRLRKIPNSNNGVAVLEAKINRTGYYNYALYVNILVSVFTNAGHNIITTDSEHAQTLLLVNDDSNVIQEFTLTDKAMMAKNIVAETITANNLAPVATSGSFEDLSDKPTYTWSDIFETTRTVPNLDFDATGNNANTYGYVGNLSKLGIEGDNVLIDSIAVYVREGSRSPNLTTKVWCRLLRFKNDAWEIVYESTESKTINDIAPETLFAFKMRNVIPDCFIKAADKIAIVYADDQANVLSSIQLGFKVIEGILGCMGAALTNSSTGASNFIPAFVIDYIAFGLDINTPATTLKRFNAGIDINGKSTITSDVDSGELKVLHNNSTKGFIIKTVNGSQSILPLLLISTNGSNHYAYSFPEKSGTVALTDDLNSKQNTLISGTNIKTINNQSILGSGDITIQGGGTSLVEITSNPKETPTDHTIAINTSNGKVFFGIANKGWWFVTAQMLGSAEIIDDTLSIQAEYDNGTISVSGEVKDGILIL